MSMPGFVFHILCPKCQKTSPDFPLYVFPDLFRPDIVLPAWSRHFRCYSELHCFLGPEDRAALEKNHDRLREFAGQLSSRVLTVGFPVWSVEVNGIQVRVEPAPECPLCGCPAEARSGYPPKESVASVQMVSDAEAVPLPMLGLSVRALNCLKGAGIGNVGELCERTPEELLAIPRFGMTTLEEVREKVEATGRKLRGE